MERVNVVGKRNVSFTDRNGTGNVISGVSFFITFTKEDVEGLMTDKLFLSAGRMSGVGYVPKVGDCVEVIYDRYGKVIGFNPVKA